MKFPKLFVGMAILSSVIIASNAVALTLDQFKSVCESSSTACDEHPVLQAYVGGALDMVATLDEQTEYMGELYCRDPKVLFDVKKIIEFMLSENSVAGSQNAMLTVIGYFEQYGGC